MHEPIIDALRRGAADEALAAAREAVAAQPQDPVAHRLLAAAQRLSGDEAGALATVEHALSLAPDDANLHLDRAGMLLGSRKLDDAQAALAKSIGLDPNQFPAYIVQAQLAIGRGDLDEAERLTRTGARLAPEHPQIAALEGTLALRRGDADRSLAMLTRAAGLYPNEPMLRHALGLAYLAKGHLAFAEQAFRGLLDRQPRALPLLALLADVLRRQGRPAEAAATLAPLLDGQDASPGLHRLAGELALEADEVEQARSHLLAAVRAVPTDRRAVAALTNVWRRLGTDDEARSALDGLLQEHPQVTDLWRARLLFEDFASDAASSVIARWEAAVPDFVPALEARMTVEEVQGNSAAVEATARRIAALEPGHAQAEFRIIDALLARDADAAVEYVERLVAKAGSEQVQRNLRQLLGRALDIASQPEAAAATWSELHAEAATHRPRLPVPSGFRGPWPELAVLEGETAAVLLLWGAPGSLVEQVAATLDASGAGLGSDRFGPNPPLDMFQRYVAVDELISGATDPGALVDEWRAALPRRGISDRQVFDWLPWWDNAVLLSLRPHLPEGLLLVAVRDPRDMLLDWLAFGSPAQFALESPEAAAHWLAGILGQLADLQDHALYPHSLLRMDEIANDPAGIAQALANALGIRIRAASPARLGSNRFGAGHWRRFAGPLKDAFDLLGPVAVRLGYPAD